ncbi:MAG: dephospho-CoA kinase, partial [Acidimicrobiales bacterium]
MLVVGLTGAIGSGKSTVARLLADRGAVVIDADAIAREVVEPDGPAYAGVVEHFGPGVVLEDGSLDRPALAALVFSDGEALSNLNRL